MSYAGRVVIYGGRGALGSKCVSYFKSNNYWIGTIDLKENPESHYNVTVNNEEGLENQESTIIKAFDDVLKGEKLDGIFCVAGGWAGGNAKKDLIKNSELMWRQSVQTSLLTASIAARYLKEGGIVQLTGAAAALEATPGMIGYGVAKASVHQLTKSLAGKNGGLPNNSCAVAILPVTLDTPMNRKWMPKADHTTWTPLEFIAELFLKWIQGVDKPSSGSLLKLITKDSKTEIVPV